MSHTLGILARAVAAVAALALGSSLAAADPLAFADPNPNSVFDQALRDRSPSTETQETVEVPANLRRQVVDYSTREGAGTIVIDTAHSYLYFVLGGGKAVRYGIGVGREGFTWSGVQTVARKAEWPDWVPP